MLFALSLIPDLCYVTFNFCTSVCVTYIMVLSSLPKEKENQA